MNRRQAKSIRPAWPLVSMEDVDIRLRQAVDQHLFSHPAYNHLERWTRNRYLRRIGAREAAALDDEKERERNT